MPRIRDLHGLIATVVTAEESGWDLTHPRLLNRARARLASILWTSAPDLARLVYGEA